VRTSGVSAIVGTRCYSCEMPPYRFIPNGRVSKFVFSNKAQASRTLMGGLVKRIVCFHMRSLLAVDSCMKRPHRSGAKRRSAAKRLQTFEDTLRHGHKVTAPHQIGPSIYMRHPPSACVNSQSTCKAYPPTLLHSFCVSDYDQHRSSHSKRSL
jgi:hypothetical protein